MLNTKDGCVHVADYKYCCSVPIMALVSTQWFNSVAFWAKQSVTSRQPSLLKFLFYEDQYAQNWICFDLPGPSAA